MSLARRVLLTVAGTAVVARAQAQGAASPERFAAVLSGHDMGAFAALFAGDYVNHQMSAAAPAPLAGMTQKALTVAFFAARLRGLPDLTVTVEASVVTPDRFAASFVYAGTQTGPLNGVAPTGRKLRFTSCDIFAMRDGLIAEHWGMGDIAGVMAQLRG